MCPRQQNFRYDFELGKITANTWRRQRRRSPPTRCGKFTTMTTMARVAFSERHMDVDERPLLVQLGWCCHNNGIASGNKERSYGSERCVLPPPMHNGRFVLRRRLPKGRRVGSGTLMIVKFKKVRRANKRHGAYHVDMLTHVPAALDIKIGQLCQNSHGGTRQRMAKTEQQPLIADSLWTTPPHPPTATNCPPQWWPLRNNWKSVAFWQLAWRHIRQSKSLAALSLLDTSMTSLPSPPRCDSTSVVAELQHRNRHLPQQQGQPTCQLENGTSKPSVAQSDNNLWPQTTQKKC
ncbi:hypothetical protein niasHT_039076 [Heterodera trifolii]|uniref:Kinase n=1 Tax=Heterodera trifolii TaxID=157864 RepID=A0ABD2HRH8_9BILA